MVKKKDELEVQRNRSNLRAAVAMNLAGIGWDVIAERRGFSSPKQAQMQVEKLMGETWGSSDVVAARARSLARKEALLRSVWDDATHPYLTTADGRDTDQRNELHLAYLDRAIRLAESIDRLQGTNAPTVVEVYRPGADEFMSTVAELRKALMAGEPEEADIFDAEVVDDEGEDDAQATG